MFFKIDTNWNKVKCQTSLIRMACQRLELNQWTLWTLYFFYTYDGIQAISDGKIGWSKFLVKNHPGPLREHILIGLDPKNCLKFSKKVNFMIFKNLVKSTKAKMAISEILPFSGKIVIAAKRKGLKRSPICQNWGILIVSKGVWCLAPKKHILGGEMLT